MSRATALPALPAPFGLTAELDAIRRRTRRGVGASFVVHALLLLLLKLTASDRAPLEGLVEITWVETPAPAPAAAAAPDAAARVTRTSPEGAEKPAKPAPLPAKERFVRAMPRGATEPRPQREKTSQDAVRERLAALAANAAEAGTQIAALLPRTDAGRPSLAAAPAASDGSPSATSLVRGESKRPTPAPAELVRATAVPTSPTSALVRLVDEPVARPPAPTASADAFPPREILAGVSLAGQVADRELTSWRLPAYPEWAKREAIEGSVRLRFFVRPDGGVKENVMIERTSGYEDFDRNATVALLDWRFEAVPGATGEQWGSITLDYQLDGNH